MYNTEQPCRVCLAEGARNIFSNMVVNDETCTVASINHIRDKLQYVTLLQVDEHDGLPFWICELCIIQLNLAYRFKRLAVESDRKLRQPLEARAAVTYDKDPAETDPIGNTITLPVKQEPDLERRNSVLRAPSSALPEEVAALCDTTTGDKMPAMVCVQKDIFNPVEDQLYLSSIFKEEVIAIPWETITPPVVTSEPYQSQPAAGNQKPSQTSRKRNRSENKPHNRERSKTKRNKSKSIKQPAVQAPEGTVAPSRPNNVTARRKRLQKLISDLHIDMMDDGMPYSLRDLSVPAGAEATSAARLPLKRRNSVCVSSFAWL
uniref:ZAD domain-containing protein n=1 Tax=Anopheles dirus TaxID=7168 RepID=A0A182N7L1_9DIPT